jgi:hypothetical protein
MARLKQAKKISPIRHKVIYVPIFDRRVLITSAPKEDWINIAIKIVAESDRDQLTDLEKAYAWTFSENLQYDNTKITAWVLFEERVSPSVIVHENVHVFETIMSSCGIEQIDEELRAYFSDWLYYEVHSIATDWKIIDSSGRR